MNILSWNVNGLSDAKREDPDFVSIISKHDVIFLYESWTSGSSDVELLGYIGHNFHRTFQHRHAKRHSGGIVVYYKKSLNDGIEIVKTHNNSVIWLKLDHSFFNIELDIYLGGRIPLGRKLTSV